MKDTDSCLKRLLSGIITKKSPAKEMKSTNTSKEHVGAESDNTCGKCQSKDTENSAMKDELLRMNELIEKLTKKQRDHEAKIEKELSDSKDIINHLSAVNNKMEDEIEILKDTVQDISQDNSQMKNILDVKQKNWIKVKSNWKRISYPVPTNQRSMQLCYQIALKSLQMKILQMKSSEIKMTCKRKHFHVKIQPNTQPNSIPQRTIEIQRTS